MCGIVGYLGQKSAVDRLIPGLKKLEYRGYDSAGVGVWVDGEVVIVKSQGRLENIERLLSPGKSTFDKDQVSESKLLSSHCGIGHTRWATHGRPTTENAHPHRIDHVVLVHNGIVENYQEIRRELVGQGYKPLSETDSELFGFLILDLMKSGKSLSEAVRLSFRRIKGQCSLVVMSEKEPDVIIGARNGSPLVVGQDQDQGALIASDVHPLVSHCKEVYYLEHGDLVTIRPGEFRFQQIETGEWVERSPSELNLTQEQIDKGGFPHYMLKEIHDQPTAIIDTLNGLLNRTEGDTSFRLANSKAAALLESAQELVLVACGTSWHAALMGKYWIERYAHIRVHVELASEFRYRQPVLAPGTVIVGVTQSGETADTLAVLREMKSQGVPCLGICNVRGSSISREADVVLYTCAGPEIGVAATKTFLSQLVTFFCIAGHLGHCRTLVEGSSSKLELDEACRDLFRIPHVLAAELETESEMIAQTKKAVQDVSSATGFFFIGRGYSYPIALEAALKLKELSYDYAEGYAAGELKHGPIAMIDEGMVVVVLAPRDPWRDKTVSNLEEVKARGAKIVGIGDSNDEDLKNLSDAWIGLPKKNRSVGMALLPFLLAPIVQLFSYYRSEQKGTDIDKPRNLAKSVTVE